MAAGAAAAAGAGLWWWLNRSRVQDDTDLRRTVAVVLAAGLACRIFLALVTPTFDAPDERAHFNYVRHLGEERTFPVARHKVDHPAYDYENFEPPLYYLAVTPVYLGASALFPDGDAVPVRAVRLVSVALWAVLVVLVVSILRILRIEDRRLLILTMLAAAVWPTHVVITSSVNNNTPLMVMGSVLLLMVLRLRALGPRQALAVGLVAGLALLTKIFALVVLLAAAGLILLRRRDLAASSARCALFLLAAGVVAALVWTPWLIRDIDVYGRINGGALDVLKPNPLTAVGSLAFGIQEFLWTFWAVAGAHNQVYLGGAVGRYGNGAIVLMGLAGGVVTFVRLRRSPSRWWDHRLRQFLLPTAVALALHVLVMAGLATRYGVGLFQGRYLFTLFVPLALAGAVVLTTAAEAVTSSTVTTHAAGACLVYVLAFVAYSAVALNG